MVLRLHLFRLCIKKKIKRRHCNYYYYYGIFSIDCASYRLQSYHANKIIIAHLEILVQSSA